VVWKYAIETRSSLLEVAFGYEDAIKTKKDPINV
jgi:hypothetical protein